MPDLALNAFDMDDLDLEQPVSENSSDSVRPSDTIKKRALRSRSSKDNVASQLNGHSGIVSARPAVLSWLPYVGPKTPIWSTKAKCKDLTQKRRHRD